MAGCTKTTHENTLRMHLPIVKLNYDPQQMEDAYSMAIATQLYRGLLRYDFTGDVRSDLAESWSESPDKLTYKIKIKKATFSNGRPITARNVQMTFARLFRLGAAMAADMEYIAGAREFKKSQVLEAFGVKAISDDTVEFNLAFPSAIFLKQLAVPDCAILPLDDFKSDLDTSAAGAFSGPYKVSSSLNENKLSLSKWRPDKYDSPNPPKNLHYFMTEKSPTDLALAGLTDTLDHDKVEAPIKEKLQKDGWAASPTELAHEIFLVLSPSKIPADLRAELYRTIDSASILAQIANPAYRPAYGLIPFGLAGELTAKDIEPLKIRVSKQKFFKQTIELDFEETSEIEQRAAQNIKGIWSSLGLEVRLNPMPKSEKLQRLFGKKSQAIIARKAMDYPDGFSVLGYFKGNYDSNYFYVNDPAVDKALVEIVREADVEKRAGAYKALQLEILKNHTVVPLFFGSEASGLWSKNLKSVPSHPLGYHTLPIETVEMK